MNLKTTHYFESPTETASESGVAFLNFWIPCSNGKRRKLGRVVLKQERLLDRKVITRLQQKDGLAALASVLELDFRLANESSTELGF